MPRKKVITDERREAELISLAVDCAERQLRDGTASSQVITHYLKMGSMRERERLEMEHLKEKNALLRAQRENMESSKNAEFLYGKVLSLMKEYGGHSDESD